MTEFRLTHAMRWFGLLIGWGCCILNFSCTSERQPNIVFILTDDQGYGDLGVYGATDIQTPHLDRLALEGAYFTSYYATQPVCSASRASILTGCYSDRIGIFNAFGPESNLGINPEELTLAEMLKNEGYATAIFGKWHLGMDWSSNDGKKIEKGGKNLDLNAPIKNGPIVFGFDYFSTICNFFFKTLSKIKNFNFF